MLLAIDMGNTQTEIGLLHGDDLLFSERIATDLHKTVTEYAVLMHSILELHQRGPKEIHGAIISSVVPPLTATIKQAIHQVTGIEALTVGPDIDHGLQISLDEPRTLGADIIVDSVGAIARVGVPNIVVDMGTATTITYIDEHKVYRGGAYIPGLSVATNALVSATSKLQKIEMEAPEHVIATNTADALKSGAIYAQASMIDGMIDRMIEESGSQPHLIATGGLAELVIPYCRHSILLDRELMIEGLKRIYDRNKNNSDRI